MSVIGGLIVLVVVLAAASAVGFGLRARSGRFQGQSSTPISDRTDRGDSAAEASRGTALTAADLGASLGQRATLVQFSTDFCTYCGPTRELLAEVAGERPGVAFVEIDAADRMDLARRLRVMSTPTVLVLGAGWRHRAPLVRPAASGRPARGRWRRARRGRRLLSFPPNKATIASVSAGPSWSARRRVTAASRLHSIWSVTSRPARYALLTKRRAVDFCRVTTAMCTRAMPAAA